MTCVSVFFVVDIDAVLTITGSHLYDLQYI